MTQPLVYRASAEEAEIAVGLTIRVPHYWRGWPDVEVTVEELKPPGPRGRWIYGTEKHGFRVQVWVSHA